LPLFAHITILNTQLVNQHMLTILSNLHPINPQLSNFLSSVKNVWHSSLKLIFKLLFSYFWHMSIFVTLFDWPRLEVYYAYFIIFEFAWVQHFFFFGKHLKLLPFTFFIFIPVIHWWRLQQICLQEFQLMVGLLNHNQKDPVSRLVLHNQVLFI